MGYFGIGLDYVLFGIRYKIKVYYDGIHIIFQLDDSFCNSRLQLPAVGRNILQKQRRITVIMQNTDSRFEIIFHSMRNIGFLTHR